jgi:hypothetical protein
MPRRSLEYWQNPDVFMGRKGIVHFQHLGDTVPPPEREPQLTLIDTAIVLLISVGLLIFIFWLATTFAGAAAFNQLPAFIQNPFQAIWSSVITGGTGIGIAIVRSVTARGRPTPNYLRQILLATGMMLVVIIAISYLARPRGPIMQLASDLTFVDPYSDTKAPVDFTLAGKPGFGPQDSYQVKGSYEIKSGVLFVHMTGGIFKLTPGFKIKPEKLTYVSVGLCYVVKQENGGESWMAYPPVSPAKGGRDLNLTFVDDQPVQLPALELKVRGIPSDLPKKKTWLCAQLWTDLGGFTPVE